MTEALFSDLILWFKEIWHLELFNSSGYTVKLNQIFIAFFVLVIGTWLSKRLTSALARRLLKRKNVNHNGVHAIQKIAYYTLLVLVLLVALPIAGIPITIFTVIGGAIAIGVGFGAQNLFNNLISGLIIMLEQPIRVGDIVEVSDSRGRIEEIGNRCVRIRRYDGVDLLIPNSHFLEQMVVNWTLLDNNIRGKISIGVAYGSPTQDVSRLLKQSAEEHSKVHSNPEPLILFTEFGDNALVFELLFWAHVATPSELRSIESDIRFKIDQLFKDAGIVIAFPQRDVHIDASKPIEVKVSREA